MLITVSDTGVGLLTGKVDHIFDAFFTTKPQGTGLGRRSLVPLSSRMVAGFGRTAMEVVT